MGAVHAKEPSQMSNLSQEEFKPLDEVPARVDKVHFEGITRTKNDVLQHVVKDLLSAKSVEEVVLKSHGVRQQLESLQVYKSIEITLDTSQGPDATPDGIEVTFNVHEKSMPSGQLMATTGNNSVNGVVQLQCANILGRGETLSVEMSRGRKNVGFNVVNSKPFLHWSRPRLNQFVFGHTFDNIWSGYQEKQKGLGLELLFESSPQVAHSFRWEAVWRNLRCLSPATPFLVREESGHSVKSSLKHTLTMDQRDNPLLPTSGYYYQLFQEYAGLGGNVSFIKNELQCQMNKCVLGDLVFQASFMGGHVKSLGIDRSVRLNDRFFLGGPYSLRGFGINGVGPQSHDCFLGAEAYWAAGFHAYTPLPFRFLPERLDRNIRTHFFYNVGNIGNFAFTDDYHHNVMKLLSDLRYSYGLGLAVAFGKIARLELNYVVPHSNQRGDKLNEGWQFGVGINFL